MEIRYIIRINMEAFNLIKGEIGDTPYSTNSLTTTAQLSPSAGNFSMIL